MESITNFSKHYFSFMELENPFLERLTDLMDRQVPKENNDACIELSKRILEKVIQQWKDASSLNSWAAEKLHCVISQLLKNEPSISDEISNILSTLWKDEHIVYYPEFVMNSFAQISLAVLHNCNSLDDRPRQKMFKIIRCPIEYFLVHKSHQMSVTFECYKSLIKTKAGFEELAAVKFDVGIAICFALASPMNYTRQSATEYLTKLVQVAFEQKNSNNLTEIIKETILSFFKYFITQERDLGVHNQRNDTKDIHKIISNFLELIGACVVSSQRFLVFLSNHSECIFDMIINLLKFSCSLCPSDIASSDSLLLIVDTLIHMINNDKETGQHQRWCQILDLLKHLCDNATKEMIPEIIEVASKILFSAETIESETQSSLIDIVLLPLCIKFGMKDLNSQFINKLIFSEVNKSLSNCSNIDQCTALKASMQAAVRLQNSSMIREHKCADLVSLITYRSASPHSSTKLQEQAVWYKYSLDFTSSMFKLILQDNNATLDALVVCNLVEFYIKQNAITYKQLQIFCQFCLSCLENCESWSSEIINAVTRLCACLEIKLSHIDSKVRETAVRETSTFYLQCFDRGLPLTSFQRSSLFSSINDKQEPVVTAVLQVILEFHHSLNLQLFLNFVEITKDKLVCEIEKVLLHREWEEIKGDAFLILSKLVSQEKAVLYAEVSRRQENSKLSSSVLLYTKNIVENCIKSLEDGHNLDAIENFFTFLLQGWGEFLLHNLDSQNISLLRLAVDVLITCQECLHRIVISGEFKKLCLFICGHHLNLFGINQHSLNTFENGHGDQLHFYKEESKACMFCISNFDSCAKAMNIGTRKEDELKSKHLDSTKSLEPFQLKLDFESLLKKLVIGFENDSIKKIFSLKIFEYILNTLNLTELREEANRSTDEYSRNTEIFLEDLWNILKKNIDNYVRKIEDELIPAFISSLTLFHEKLNSKLSEKNNSELAFDLLSKTVKLSTFLDNSNDFAEFALQNQDIFLVHHMETNDFIFKIFTERLKHLKLDPWKHMNFKQNQKPVFSDMCEDLLHEFTESISKSLNENTGLISDISQIIKAKTINQNILSENMIKKFQYYHLKELKMILSDSKPLENLTIQLESLLKESPKIEQRQGLIFIRDLSQHVLCCFFNSTNFQEGNSFSSMLEQISNWWSEKDEYDSEDDSVHIDCF